MYRAWGVIASAIVAVALEVGIKLVADSVAVPRNYFIPIGVFVFLVGLQVFLTLRGQRAPEHRRERADVRLNDGRHTIKGDWHRPSGVTVWAIVVVTGVSMLLGGISEVRKAPVGLLIATLCFVTVLAALCTWVALGSRVHLQFSAAGVAVWRALGRRRRLRWPPLFSDDGRLSDPGASRLCELVFHAGWVRRAVHLMGAGRSA